MARKIKTSIIAFALSVLVPGLGQIFIGRPKIGGLVYLSFFLLYCLLHAGIYATFPGLMIWIGTLILLQAWNLTGTLFHGDRGTRITHDLFRHWLVYLLVVMVHLALILPGALFFGMPVKPYRIPSASMSPTLQLDDYFLIDRTWYRNAQVRRGDVVVFASPTDSKVDFVKRVVGLSGEMVQIKKGMILINGRPLTALPEPAPNYLSSTNGGLSDYYFESQTVPPNHVFVVGDNPKNSFDSRFFKSIDIAAVRGKALYIIWADELSRVGKNL